MARPGEVRVEGLDTLRRTLGRASDQIEDGSPATEKTAAYVAAQSSRGAPKDTGRLSRGHRTRVEKGVAGIENATPYAGFVYFGTRGNGGRPWMIAQAFRTLPRWEGFYQDQAQHALSKVRGA